MKSLKIRKKNLPNLNLNEKWLFISDLHLHDRKSEGEYSRLQEGLSILDQIVQLCQREQISWVFHLGDAFEQKDRIPTHILLEFKKRIVQLYDMGVKFKFLQGNHDYNLPQYSYLKIFDFIDYVDTPQIQYIPPIKIGFIPYERNEEQFKLHWNNIHKEHPSMVLFHQELEGVTYENGIVVQNGIRVSTQDSIIYISGHIHAPQKLNSIYYIGSPYQFSFTSISSDRFVWVFYPVGFSLIPVQLDYTKFLSLPIDYILTQPTNELYPLVKNNCVRVIGQVERDQLLECRKKALQKLQSMKVKNVTFQLQIITPQTTTVDLSSSVSDEDIIADYVTKTHSNYPSLDKDKLIELGQTLIMESK